MGAAAARACPEELLDATYGEREQRINRKPRPAKATRAMRRGPRVSDLSCGTMFPSKHRVVMPAPGSQTLCSSDSAMGCQTSAAIRPPHHQARPRRFLFVLLDQKGLPSSDGQSNG